MPSADTFDCPPIEGFVKKYLTKSNVSVDPFARNNAWATHTNDINPDTKAKLHLEARAFLNHLTLNNIKADLIIFDPPYSPRQIAENYKSAGLLVSQEDTQNARLYSACRAKFREILAETGVVLSFGWNSVGMGNGFRILEIMLVCHGGAHNDTICMAEEKLPVLQHDLFDHHCAEGPPCRNPGHMNLLS